MCFAPQRRALFRHRNVQKWSETPGVLTLFTSKCASRHNGVHFFDICVVQKSSEADVFWHFWLPNVLLATTACTFCTTQLPKVVRTRRVLYIFTSKCASRHNGVHFFHISTSKSAPTLTCFATFLLPNVLRATTACTFSTSQLPKVLRDRRVLPLLTSKCASRHNGVQFFISHLPRCLRTRRFSEPTFRPSGATKHWKNTVFRDFPTFSRTCIFSLFWLSASLIFSLLTFSRSEFLPACAISISPYCRKFSFQTSFEHSYGKWPFVVDFARKNSDFPQLC